MGESPDHLRAAFTWATSHFRTVWWCPGNHELYTMESHAPQAAVYDDDHPRPAPPPRGEAKYLECVAVAREYGVLTPEDDFVTWDCGDDGQGGGGGSGGGVAKALVCPIFTLYDYSFRPAHVTREGALAWAEEQGICATDEVLLHPDPHPTRDAWCEALTARFEARLEVAAAAAAAAARQDPPGGLPLVIANHWPLLERLVELPAVPRFRLWCGTSRTEGWHARFRAAAVVSGHLHLRRTDWVDGVRFEEVSLGYPRQWERARAEGRDINAFLREILPGPAGKGEEGVTQWRMNGDVGPVPWDRG